QLVTLLPVIEARQLIALQALLARVQQMRPRVALIYLAHDHRDALANLGYRHRWRPFFFPARFLGPETRLPGATAFDDAASPSNCAPHSQPNPLRSCCAVYTPRCDVRL